jgi:hypothetical protein
MYRKAPEGFNSTCSSSIFRHGLPGEQFSPPERYNFSRRPIEEIGWKNNLNIAATHTHFAEIIGHSNLASVFELKSNTPAEEEFCFDVEEESKHDEDSYSLTNFFSQQQLKSDEIIPPSEGRQTSSIVLVNRRGSVRKTKRMDSLCFKDTESLNSEESRSISEVISDH